MGHVLLLACLCWNSSAVPVLQLFSGNCALKLCSELLSAKAESTVLHKHSFCGGEATHKVLKRKQGHSRTGSTPRQSLDLTNLMGLLIIWCINWELGWRMQIRHLRWLYRNKLGPCCLSGPYLHSTVTHRSFAELSSQHACVGGKLHIPFSKTGRWNKRSSVLFSCFSPKSNRRVCKWAEVKLLSPKLWVPQLSVLY